MTPFQKDALLSSLCKILETTGWTYFSLPAAASQLNMSPQTLKTHFPSSQHVLEAFFDRIHLSVCKALPQEPNIPFEEKLLESLMIRFDQLAPWKKLVQNLTADGFSNPCLGILIMRHVTKSFGDILPILHPQTSLLTLPVVLSIYGKCMSLWLEDTTEGSAQTLAQADTLIRRFSFLMQASA